MVSRIMCSFRYLRQRWQQLRRHYWLALGIDVAALVLVFSLISHWQASSLLAADGSKHAPPFQLRGLDGAEYSLAASAGKTRLLYFFAPWCHVCALSAGNIENLRRWRDEEVLAIYMIALSYDSEASVREFASKHELHVPVLLGNDELMRDYQIRGFPTYYVVDTAGQLQQRALGYSTSVGLWWRTR